MNAFRDFGVLALSLAFGLLLVSGAAAGDRWFIGNYGSEQMGPASPSSEEYTQEEMTPAVPGLEREAEELAPAGSEFREGFEEMTPAGSEELEQEERYEIPDFAPYEAPERSEFY